MERRKITDSIVIHCSATPEGRDYDVAEIRRWHLARGFSDVGYHFIVRLDGTIEAGRPEWAVGAHCVEAGMNRRSIGVCYIGGMNKDMSRPMDTRTEAQKRSLVKLVRQLQVKYGIADSSVYGHRDFAAKACPSFDVKDLLKWVAMIFVLISFGCSRKVYVPVEREVKNVDTVSIVKWRERERYDRDTVMVVMRGDTLVKDVVRWRERILVKRDTVYHAVSDTILVKESLPGDVVGKASGISKTWGIIMVGLLLILTFIVRRIMR